ncbi:MAG: segregation/condensation protein A [Candidatus Marinimicrobia bacterium]|jgi:segregation and condensation protein A|nr:segregation/condensation protein A [Candidatus Neomarinimicrobiota bacterium]
MAYEVKIENFEGPMDLLLFFIHRDKLNIYDIPISHITNEFLEYLKVMEILNIDVGGEFVYMASLLMKIKAKMLLPVSEGEDEEIEDPRTPLVQRLLEYQQYKEVGEALLELHENHLYQYPLGNTIPVIITNGQQQDVLHNVTLFSLSSIFQELLHRLPEVNPYELRQEPIQLEDQIQFLLQALPESGSVTFTSLFPSLQTKLKIVVTFMAILELLRNKQIHITQAHPFGDVSLSKAA